MSVTRPAHPTPDTNVSVTLGFSINDRLRSKIAFLDDVPIREVSQTCERCHLTDCTERTAPPDVLHQVAVKQQIALDLKALNQKINAT